MENPTSFKTQIFIHTLVAAALFEAGSLPLLGFSLEYLLGLIAGTAVSIISFTLLYTMSERVLRSGVKWLSSAGYAIRLPMYGIVFIACVKLGGTNAGLACLLGFMTGIVAIIYVHGIKSKFSKGKGRP